MRKILIPFILMFFVCGKNVIAQDTLPNISVKNINNQIVVSWKNNYKLNIANLNIQRSYDSTKNFITIGTVLNPTSKENGYVDRKALNPAKQFYRVFIAFEGGTYLFSLSHHPVIDTSHIAPIITEIIKNEVLPATDENLLPPFKNPVKPAAPKGFVPSKYIFTGKDNNLVISLPDAAKEKFSLHFFDEKDKLVFEIKKIKEPWLIVEKVNFLHTGWFYYQLFNDGILLEKYKFYIGADGRVGPPPPENKKIIFKDK